MQGFWAHFNNLLYCQNCSGLLFSMSKDSNYVNLSAAEINLDFNLFSDTHILNLILNHVYI